MTPKPAPLLSKLLRYGLPLTLALGLGLSTWKMLQFQRRLHDFIDNQSWEATLRANGAFQAPPIVFFGDSDIANWWLAPAFGSLPIMNRGVGGDQAARAMPRFERDALAAQPSVVVLLMGSNDLTAKHAPQTVANDIAALISRARERKARVIVCSILPVSGEVLKQVTNDTIVATNALIKAAAERQGARYVDLHSALVDAHGRFGGSFTVEGFHANARGYFEMSRLLHPVLVKAYADPGT